MSTVGKASKPRKAPNQTRNGKLRVGPLSLNKLQELIEKSCRPRDKRKYQNRINIINKRGV